jgi:hypothetical protein
MSCRRSSPFLKMMAFCSWPRTLSASGSGFCHTYEKEATSVKKIFLLTIIFHTDPGKPQNEEKNTAGCSFTRARASPEA